MITSNVTTLTLNGSETAVEFEKGYPYYFITNRSDTDMHVSMSPGITPKAEGVYMISAGSTERIGTGYELRRFYILGSGEAYIRGEEIAAQPSFKKAGKGGDVEPIPTGFDMTGITARFDVPGIDVENKIWTNSVVDGENLTFTDGSVVNNSLMISGNNHGSFLSDNVPDVIYLVAKKNIPESYGAIFGQSGSPGHGNSIGLFGAQSTNVSFEVSIYNPPYIDIYADPEKYHLFTFVETPERLSTLILFTDGILTGMLNGFNKSSYNGIMCLNGNTITGNSNPAYLCQQPAYFKHISVGRLSQRADWDFTEWERVYNNMGWLMKNIVNPANEEV